MSPTERTSFRPFKHHKDLYDLFVKGRDQFMDVDELNPAVRRSLHPHFLRGLCTDWMVLILKMTCEEAAEVLGIHPNVLEKEYLSQDREYDAGPMFDNARHRAEQLEGEFQTRIEGLLEKVNYTQEKILETKDKEISMLKAEIEMLKAQQRGSPLAIL